MADRDAVQSAIYVSGIVAYDGTDYKGFQYQNNVPTVQGCLEAGLKAITGASVRIAGSGRTDSGVHANGQVIAAEVPWRHDLYSLQKAWNVNIPRSIAVRKLQAVPKSFHPRFSAGRRTYRYTVFLNPSERGKAAPQNSPLTDRYALCVNHPLDISLMNVAAELLVGTHNFSTFGRSPEDVTPIRTVFAAEWQRVETNLTPLIGLSESFVFTITANGFLRQMVRNLVSSLLQVGGGNWSVASFRDAFFAQERARSAPLAPPNGLVLEKVDYPDYIDLFR